MDIAAAEKLIDKHLVANGLSGLKKKRFESDPNWSYSLSKKPLTTVFAPQGTILALCHQNERRIEFSYTFILRSPEKAVEQVIIHEIAHALVPGAHTHEWEQKARELGYVSRLSWHEIFDEQDPELQTQRIKSYRRSEVVRSLPLMAFGASLALIVVPWLSTPKKRK